MLYQSSVFLAPCFGIRYPTTIVWASQEAEEAAAMAAAEKAFQVAAGKTDQIDINIKAYIKPIFVHVLLIYIDIKISGYQDLYIYVHRI